MTEETHEEPVFDISKKARPDGILTDDIVLLFPPGRPPGSMKNSPWSWENEGHNIRTRECMCCGRPGHYQETLEAYIAEYGLGEDMGILIRDGRVCDGHHRVVAAIALGIGWIPLETENDAQARWIRDHGYVDWQHRKFGDL